MHRRNDPERRAVAADSRQSDQIGEVIFIRRRARGSRSRSMNSFVLVSRSAARAVGDLHRLAVDDLGYFGDAFAHPAQREPPSRLSDSGPYAVSAAGSAV